MRNAAERACDLILLKYDQEAHSGMVVIDWSCVHCISIGLLPEYSLDLL
jgi:hypothetical protein